MKVLSFLRRIPWWACWGLSLVDAPGLRASLPLYPQRDSPFDLAIKGGLVGVPEGAIRYVRYADLRALPTTKLHIADEFVHGDQEVTIVYLAELWAALPVRPEADCLLATCSDQYASVFRRSFIATYRPFLVLEINGEPPERWSGSGLVDDPGPYAITVSPTAAPGAPPFVSMEHKKPWGVVALEFGQFGQKFYDAYHGRWATLSDRASLGRDLWVNACACCHPGPGQTYSGTKSHQPFAIIAAIAKGDAALFRTYVREPTAVNPKAKMEAHPYFTDTQLNAIIAFIGAEPP